MAAGSSESAQCSSEPMPGVASSPGRAFMPMDRCRPPVDRGLTATARRARLPDHLRLYRETQRQIKSGELKAQRLTPPVVRLRRGGVRPAAKARA